MFGWRIPLTDLYRFVFCVCGPVLLRPVTLLLLVCENVYGILFYFILFWEFNSLLDYYNFNYLFAKQLNSFTFKPTNCF